jgi:hypothetical protein
VILKLDFEKTFDKVEHEVILQVLRHEFILQVLRQRVPTKMDQGNNGI